MSWPEFDPSGIPVRQVVGAGMPKFARSLYYPKLMPNPASSGAPKVCHPLISSVGSRLTCRCLVEALLVAIPVWADGPDYELRGERHFRNKIDSHRCKLLYTKDRAVGWVSFDATETDIGREVYFYSFKLKTLRGTA